MTQAIQKQHGADALERALLTGDLSTLAPEDRILYYNRTCESLGLNPLTKPFEYIKLNGKLTLYARKDATDQLRKLNGVSISKPDIQQIDNLIIVTVEAADKTGRTDSDIGVVGKNDMGGNIGNALMKAVTKAKRRVTLSICGLGMLDETEVETIPDAQPIPVEIAQATSAPATARLNEMRQTVTEWLSMLNAANDSIIWTAKTLNEYVNEMFATKNGIGGLGVDELQILIDDLEGRHYGLTEVESDEKEVETAPASAV